MRRKAVNSLSFQTKFSDGEFKCFLSLMKEDLFFPQLAAKNQTKNIKVQCQGLLNRVVKNLFRGVGQSKILILKIHLKINVPTFQLLHKKCRFNSKQSASFV